MNTESDTVKISSFIINKVAAVSDYTQCYIRSYWVRLRKNNITYKTDMSDY